MPRKREQETDPLVTELRDKVEEGVEFFRPLVADTELTLAFLSGNQWVASSQSRGLVPVANETNELRDQDNQMLNHFRRWNYYLFQDDPVIVAHEGGKEIADAERANVASTLADYWEQNNGLREARREAAQWAGVAGIGWIVPTWRKNLKRVKKRTLEYVEDGVEDDEGQISFVQEKEKEEGRSDILVESYCPLQVFPFPLLPSRWERTEGVLTVDIATIDWIHSEIDSNLAEEELEAVQPEELNMEAIRRINRFVSPQFGYMPSRTNEQNKYLVAQWFERPSSKHEKGRYVLMAGGNIVKNTKLPFFEEARSIDPTDRLNLTLGIIPVRPMEFPGRLIPPAPFGADMRKAQVRINDLLTDMRQNRKTVGRSKLVYEQGTLDEEQWTDEHGERIPLKPGTSVTPQVVQGSPLQGIDYEYQLASRSFEQQSGQTQALQGQNPSQVRSAFHLDILREEGMSLFYDTISNMEESYEWTVKLMLEVARQRYTVDRLIEIYGQDYEGRALTFATAIIDTDIRVQRGSQKPRNKAVTEGKLIELLQYGAFGQNAENIDQFWQMSELGTLNRAVDEEQAHRLRARKENTRMIQYKEIIQPYEHEPHALHIEEHRGGMSRPEWYDADEDVQLMTMTHLETHRQMLAEQLAPQASQDTQPVAGLASSSAIPATGGKGGAGATAGLQAAATGAGGQSQAPVASTQGGNQAGGGENAQQGST